MTKVIKKKDQAIINFNRNIKVFQCPICKTSLSVDGQQLKCIHNHVFDIAKKGYVNLLTQSHSGIYTKDLFESRNIISQAGFFKPMLDRISETLKAFNKDHLSILDAGCGEGSHLAYLRDSLQDDKTVYIGTDISKDSIQIATRETVDILWMVSDLKQLPIDDSKLDIVLNILSPANYDEFKRVLSNNGLVIKIVPSSNYLKEIRALIKTNKTSYSNDDVIQHLSNKMTIIKSEHIQYTFDLTPDLAMHLMKMTPLTNHQVLEDYVEDLKQVTVDYMMVIATFNGENHEG